MGGSAGLFIGASLLSFAEIFYYFLIRFSGVLIEKNETDDDLSTDHHTNAEHLDGDANALTRDEKQL